MTFLNSQYKKQCLNSQFSLRLTLEFRVQISFFQTTDSALLPFWISLTCHCLGPGRFSSYREKRPNSLTNMLKPTSHMNTTYVISVPPLLPDKQGDENQLMIICGAFEAQASWVFHITRKSLNFHILSSDGHFYDIWVIKMSLIWSFIILNIIIHIEE